MRRVERLPWYRRLPLRAVGWAMRSLSTFGSVLASSVTESGFSAARWTRLTSDWTIFRRSVDQEVADDLAVLRARSRNLVLNSPYVRRYHELVAMNVAGPTGVKFKAKIEAPDGAPDLAANRLLEQAFADWSRVGVCTVDGRLSRAAVERLICQTVPQDGEVFIRFVAGASNPFGFALQVIDADLCDHLFSRQANAERGLNEVRMGVEIDAWGKPLGYWMFTEHPSETGTSGRARTFVPATDLLHLYVPIRPGQTRGVPWTHAVLQQLRDLDKYQEAELVQSRIAAAKGGFFTSGNDAALAPAEGSERFSMQVEPGLFEALPPGLNFEVFDPQHPVQAYGDFVSAVLHSIATGLNVSYHNLASDLNAVNYSSARIGEMAERDHWRTLQGWLIEHFHERLYPEWLRWALTTGRLRFPARDYERLRMVEWQPRGWAWVDPQNELSAIETALKLKLTSRTKVAAAQGNDLEEIFSDLQAEEDLAEEYGVTLPGGDAGELAMVDEPLDDPADEAGDRGTAWGGRMGTFSVGTAPQLRDSNVNPNSQASTGNGHHG